MKRTIIALSAALSLLFSCSREIEAPSVEGGMKTFSLGIVIPDNVQTRSSISGAEGIFSLQMLCFDVNKLYLGLGAVTFLPGSQEGNIYGTLTGRVPEATASIHFIANAGLEPDENWRGLSENELVGPLTSDASNTNIVYWGYHREATVEAMQNWLDASPRNTIYLLRDRAKVTLSEPDHEWDHNFLESVTEHIIEARFAVCNGLAEGLIAPFDKSQLSFSYEAPLTLPEDKSRFRGEASELVSHEGAQFLFEDENSLANPVKVILETRYEVISEGDTTEIVKYHQVLLMREDHTLYQIRRNHQFNLIIGNLPSALAYDSFEDALEGAPSNNQTVYIQEIIPSISSEDHTLNILGGTSRIVREGSFATIEFTFLENGLPDPDIDVSNFSATWISNHYVADPDANLVITEGDDPGHFVLHVQLYQPITSDLKSGKILLLDKKYGLARYINLYSITAFDFDARLIATGDADNPYRLSFTVPENFPAAFCPFSVRLATEDFKPTAQQNSEKALGVVVDDTDEPIGTDWDYWYTYEVPGPGDYEILLTPVDDRSGTLSVYMQAGYFGTLDDEGNMLRDYVKLDIDK